MAENKNPGNKPNKKVWLCVGGAVLLCVVLFIILGGIGVFEEKEPNLGSWTGIYRGTEYINEYTKVSYGVVIEEDDIRNIKVTVKYKESDLFDTWVDNAIELPKDKTNNICITMLAYEPVEGEGRPNKTVYIELKREDTEVIYIRYATNKDELEKEKFIKLERTVV